MQRKRKKEEEGRGGARGEAKAKAVRGSRRAATGNDQQAAHLPLAGCVQTPLTQCFLYGHRSHRRCRGAGRRSCLVGGRAGGAVCTYIVDPLRARRALSGRSAVGGGGERELWAIAGAGGRRGREGGKGGSPGHALVGGSGRGRGEVPRWGKGGASRTLRSTARAASCRSTIFIIQTADMNSRNYFQANERLYLIYSLNTAYCKK